MRLSGTLSRAISTSRGFGNQLYDLAGERPSLDLPFADQKSLVDAATGSQPVTFTRASSGTYVDSQGVIRTATTNLLLRSEEFNDAYWTKSATSITANDIASPVGTITADKLVEDSANSQHTIGSQSISWLGNTQYTFTLYAKAAGRDTFDLLLGTAGNWVNSNRVAIFNLTSGVVEFQDGSPVSASIQNIGGGWFRCRITSTTVASPSASAVFLRLYDKSTATGGSSSYQGNGSSGVHIWGAQLEQSSTVGEYIPTGATINSAPRFDHNPTTGECLGLLVEEQRTNLAFPSNMPTSTTQTTTGNMQANGATQITSGVVAPDGSTNGFTVSGASVTTNTSGSNNVRILNVMAAAGTHTVSMWIKTNTSPTTVTVRDATTAISFNFTTTSAWTRISATFNNTSAGNIVLLSTSGAAFDCFGVQVESGSFPTSYIPTTTAAATRSADVASITGSNFSSWYRQDEGTVFAETQLQSTAARNAVIVDINDTTTSNRNIIRALTTGSDDRLIIRSGNTTVASLSSGSGPGLIIRRTVGAYRVDDFSFTAQGLAPAIDTTGAVPASLTQMLIGSALSLSEPLGGTIRRLTYFPTRLSNTTLQQITQ